MSEAKEIRKQSAQYDLFHRLHSIAADERFVKTVARESYQGRFEVVGEGQTMNASAGLPLTYTANQRCGTWYCDPSVSTVVLDAE
jgi:tRNA A64-2'-O-ribosylphosphate transferase